MFTWTETCELFILEFWGIPSIKRPNKFSHNISKCQFLDVSHQKITCVAKSM